MDQHAEILEHCKRLVTCPEYRDRYLKTISGSRRIIGYFSNYIPSEVIAAAGFHPLRIIGLFNTAGSRPLPRPLCSFVQDVFAAGLNGMFSDLSAMIFPNSCDSLKALRQNWSFQSIPALVLNHPINTDRNAAAYLAGQVRQLALDLQQLSGSALSHTALHETAAEYNEIRRLLRRLYALRTRQTVDLNYSDLSAVLTAGFIIERTEYLTCLRRLNDVVAPGSPKRFTARVFVAGPLVDHVALLEKIEELGGLIVDDDVTNGRRYCDDDVALQGDLYENIALRLLSDPSPALNGQSAKMLFQKRIQETQPDKVIFINQKHCEPHVHRYLEKKDWLDRMGIPHLMLHIDHAQARVQADDLLRLESFMEMPAGQ
jgi:benzoyl-CoA reductase/2-hydroxyglutaryl-CoA dehydratase subunit BcrC/BadD/HgdB